MQAFDASSMIYAWDSYPIRQFPGLWDWMATQVEEKNLVMPSVAFDEVSDKTPECGEWLKDHDVELIAISNPILQDAMRIKKLIGVVDDNYHAKGVGENDLLIIAAARSRGIELVSDEERQPTLPKEPSKRKIPAVCAMKEVTVDCINYIEYLKKSDVVFR